MAAQDPDRRRDGEELPAHVVADLLASDRRREALAVLAERSERIALDDLAAAVCAREDGRDPGAVPAEDRRSVRTELFQRHLPKLTATDVVAYDSVLGAVELTDAERVETALRDG